MSTSETGWKKWNRRENLSGGGVLDTMSLHRQSNSTTGDSTFNPSAHPGAGIPWLFHCHLGPKVGGEVWKKRCRWRSTPAHTKTLLLLPLCHLAEDQVTLLLWDTWSAQPSPVGNIPPRCCIPIWTDTSDAVQFERTLKSLYSVHLFFIYIFPPLFISALNVSNRKLAAIVAGMHRSAHAHNGFCCIQIRKKCCMNRNLIENQPCHFPPSVFPFSRSYCSDYLYLIWKSFHGTRRVEESGMKWRQPWPGDLNPFISFASWFWLGRFQNGNSSSFSIIGNSVYPDNRILDAGEQESTDAVESVESQEIRQPKFSSKGSTAVQWRSSQVGGFGTKKRERNEWHLLIP